MSAHRGVGSGRPGCPRGLWESGLLGGKVNELPFSLPHSTRVLMSSFTQGDTNLFRYRHRKLPAAFARAHLNLGYHQQ